MKKSKLVLCLVLLCSLFFTVSVNAVEPTVGKIIGNYDYGDEKLAGADAAIYKIGNVTPTENSYTYELLDEFMSEKVDFATLTYEQREAKTKKLYNIITEKSIKPLSQVKTNQSGQFTFEGLTAGLYLIKVNDLTTEEGVYRSSPALIFYPDVAEAGSYIYDVSINMKTEFVKADDNNNNNDDNNNVNDNNNNGGSNVNVPNTYDAIVMYVVLFIVSAVLLAVLICYIYMYNKKKGKKENEKNEEK